MRPAGAPSPNEAPGSWCLDSCCGCVRGGGGPRGSPDAALLSWAAVPSCQRPFSHSGSPTVRTSAPVLCRPCLDQKNPGPRVSCWEVGLSAPALQRVSAHRVCGFQTTGLGGGVVCVCCSPPGSTSPSGSPLPEVSAPHPKRGASLIALY